MSTKTTIGKYRLTHIATGEPLGLRRKTPNEGPPLVEITLEGVSGRRSFCNRLTVDCVLARTVGKNDQVFERDLEGLALEPPDLDWKAARAWLTELQDLLGV